MATDRMKTKRQITSRAGDKVRKHSSYMEGETYDVGNVNIKYNKYDALHFTADMFKKSAKTSLYFAECCKTFCSSSSNVW